MHTRAAERDRLWLPARLPPVHRGWLPPPLSCASEGEVHNAQQAAMRPGVRKKRGALPPCWISVGLLALVSYTCLVCAAWEEFYF